MDVREKLVELLNHEFGKKVSEITADWLIAHGVTVQEWIPVTDRKPTKEDADEDGFVLAYTAENKKIIAFWTDVCRFSEYVTRWMPLPQPPKGE